MYFITWHQLLWKFCDNLLCSNTITNFLSWRNTYPLIGSNTEERNPTVAQRSSYYPIACEMWDLGLKLVFKEKNYGQFRKMMYLPAIRFMFWTKRIYCVLQLQLKGYHTKKKKKGFQISNALSNFLTKHAFHIWTRKHGSESITNFKIFVPNYFTIFLQTIDMILTFFK